MLIKSTKKEQILKIAIICTVFIVCSCVKTVENTGYVSNSSRFDKIERGVTTKEEALKILGSPSSKSTFGGEKWYYIGFKIRHTAFLESETTDKKITLVKFDENGVVKDVNRNYGNESRDIKISEDKTLTKGNKVNAIEQFLGNLGRFNTSKTPVE